jgi:uncharacterized protein (TIGR00369 family)
MSHDHAPLLTRERLQQRVSRAPFNAWLGLEVVDWDDGSVTLKFAMRPELCGHATLQAALHGGIIAAVLDVGCSMAVMARTGASLFTVDMRIDYLRPAKSRAFTVRGEVVRLGRTLATSDARLFSDTNQLLATGRALLQHLPEPASAR